MKLVSMKKEDGHGKGCSCCDASPSGCSEPDYPWGLRITLDEEQLAAMGVKALPASGSPVGIEAAAMVVSQGEETRDGKVHRRLELQITDLALASAGTSKYAKMYEADPTMKD